jgi:hypothetical protein
MSRNSSFRIRVVRGTTIHGEGTLRPCTVKVCRTEDGLLRASAMATTGVSVETMAARGAFVLK